MNLSLITEELSPLPTVHRDVHKDLLCHVFQGYSSHDPRMDYLVAGTHAAVAEGAVGYLNIGRIDSW